MKNKDVNGSFHTLEINLPIIKKGKGFQVNRDKLIQMEEDGEIETMQSDKKKKKK